MDQVKFVKRLLVPAALLFSVVLAAPVSAHQLGNATVSVTCQTPAGQVCVTLTGDIASDNDARDVFFQLFEKGDSTPLDTIEFELPAFKPAPGADNHFSRTICFKPIAGGSRGFVVEVVRVTDTRIPAEQADLAIQLGTGSTSMPIQFTPTSQPATAVGACAPAPQAQTATTSTVADAASTPTPTPADADALAQTGGFDFRYPLIGLLLLVAGGTLYLVSASRERPAVDK